MLPWILKKPNPINPGYYSLKRQPTNLYRFFEKDSFKSNTIYDISCYRANFALFCFSWGKCGRTAFKPADGRFQMGGLFFVICPDWIYQQGLPLEVAH